MRNQPHPQPLPREGSSESLPSGRLEGVVSRYLQRTGFEAFTPKAVLFDMDGVLMNSMPNHAIAWQRSMASFGLKMTEADAYATEGARGIDTIRNLMKAQTGKDITLEEAQRMYDEKTRQFGLLPKAQVMEGALELHEKIHRDGLTICIVTGSGQRPLINRLLTEFPRVTEERLVTAYDVKKGKPLPDPYLMGMEKCGVKPWETIVVENAPLGIKSGNAAKAFTIAINTGILPDEILWDAGADIVLSGMPELCERWREFKPLFLPTRSSGDAPCRR